MSRTEIPRCGYLTLPPGATIARTSALHELTWMDEGAALVTIAAETRRLTTREFALCPPGVDVEYRWTEESVRLGFILFDHPGDADWGRFRRMGTQDVTPGLLRHILWLQAAQPANWAASIEYLFDYVLRLWRTGASSTDLRDGPPLSEHVHDAVMYVAQLWSDGPWVAPRLADLARAAGIAPGHLSRLFAAEVGAAPLTTLRRLRVHRATLLLVESRLTVRQVAVECGFENEFHFSAAFKKVVGVAPQNYRRQETPFELSPALRGIARRIGGGLTEQYLPVGPLNFAS